MGGTVAGGTVVGATVVGVTVVGVTVVGVIVVGITVVGTGIVVAGRVVVTTATRVVVGATVVTLAVVVVARIVVVVARTVVVVARIVVVVARTVVGVARVVVVVGRVVVGAEPTDVGVTVVGRDGTTTVTAGSTGDTRPSVVVGRNAGFPDVGFGFFASSGSDAGFVGCGIVTSSEPATVVDVSVDDGFSVDVVLADLSTFDSRASGTDGGVLAVGESKRRGVSNSNGSVSVVLSDRSAISSGMSDVVVVTTFFGTKHSIFPAVVRRIVPG